MQDIYGLGNALVDMEFGVADDFLVNNEVAKGMMTLVDEQRQATLQNKLTHLEPQRMSGGSAANTIIAAQGFGCSTFYSCKVADDDAGNHFVDQMRQSGVSLNDNAVAPTGTSGRCLILVTPDAERSMNTFLGISSELSESDVDEQALSNSRYFYVEGYLSSSPASLDAAIACRELAQRNGVKTAVSLSDPSMVEFFGDNLRKILGNGIDHLFCNEEEALSFTKTDRLDVAVSQLKDIAKSLNITLGARGSLTVTEQGQNEVAGFAVNAIDTNGAGDIYAGACLAALCQSKSADYAARFANFAASKLIVNYGARLRKMTDYQTLQKSFPT